MKILYGINGTGNGHITKSLNIIYKLKKINNVDIDILISGDNYTIDLPLYVKYKLKGLSLIYNSEGSIDYHKTYQNLDIKKFFKDIKLSIDSYDKIVTDFEPVTSWASKLNKRECIGISHQYSFLSKKSPRPNHKSFIGELILKNMAPVTNPIGLHFNKYDEFILHPIIREDIQLISSHKGDYYTVYLPSYNLNSIMNELLK